MEPNSPARQTPARSVRPPGPAGNPRNRAPTPYAPGAAPSPWLLSRINSNALAGGRAAACGRKQQRRVDVVAPSRLREAVDVTYAATPTVTDALTAAPTRRTAREIGGELCVELAGVCWLDRSRLTRLLGRTVARAGEAAVRRRRARRRALVVHLASLGRAGRGARVAADAAVSAAERDPVADFRIACASGCLAATAEQSWETAHRRQR
jgi:hypothetical protein